MDLETFRKYCLAKKGTTESYPFDDTTLVFKVGSKMFALAMTDRKPLQVNLKNEPSLVLDLRDRYEAVLRSIELLPEPKERLRSVAQNYKSILYGSNGCKH